MILKSIDIIGYRGFREKGIIDFAIPTGSFGSGLTILTGANNSGKSSILECIRARSGHQNVSFTSGARNSKGDSVEINYRFDGGVEKISSVQKGSSETKHENKIDGASIFVLSSRRSFDPYFNKSAYDRNTYLLNSGLPAQRSASLSTFAYRLFNTIKNAENFNNVLYKVLVNKPKWTIDLSDQGQYFLKFIRGDQSHTSDGVGEGIISIFAIVDALYDSESGSMTVIDEPELSLHPDLQKKVYNLICDYARDRQIVISTHSPYFIDMNVIVNGAKLLRVNNSENGTTLHPLSKEAVDGIAPLLKNKRNPHILGLNACELFFQEDGIILTEGQDDVVYLPTVAEQIGVELPGSLFGWGAGGADNIRFLCKVFASLGFKKVACVLDNDKENLLENLRLEFPKYHFACIPAKDIRSKEATKAKHEVLGLLDSKYIMRSEFIKPTKSLFGEISSYIG